MSDTTTVTTIPKCDICSNAPAIVDGKMKGRSSWAFMCEFCWAMHGIGRLGTGYGQRLVLADVRQNNG